MRKLSFLAQLSDDYWWIDAERYMVFLEEVEVEVDSENETTHEPLSGSVSNSANTPNGTVALLLCIAGLLCLVCILCILLIIHRSSLVEFVQFVCVQFNACARIPNGIQRGQSEERVELNEPSDAVY